MLCFCGPLFLLPRADKTTDADTIRMPTKQLLPTLSELNKHDGITNHHHELFIIANHHRQIVTITNHHHQLPTVINHHQPATEHYHWSSSPAVSHHQLLIIINHHHTIKLSTGIHHRHHHQTSTVNYRQTFRAAPN